MLFTSSTPLQSDFDVSFPSVNAIGVFDTTLTDYERVRLNAMEERVLPPYVRIKIVFAQANAGDREEEIEASVSSAFEL